MQFKYNSGHPDLVLHCQFKFASGGVDFEAAKAFGVKVIWALSLPGKIAPVTSGAIIKDTIMNIIKELGV